MISSEKNPQFSRLQLAQLRAHSFYKARAFFDQRQILAVDTPILSQGVSLDAHIDFFATQFYPNGVENPAPSKTGYLQTSPEPHLKRLLCEGFPDLYQITKAFRNGESGRRHNPEFTMVEWYRRGMELPEMEAETLEFCRHLAGEKPVVIWNWEEAWKRFLGFSPFEIQEKELRAHPVLTELGVSNADLPTVADIWDLIMAQRIEPEFDPKVYTVIRHFPIAQAAQSLAHPHFPHLALRFEVYSGGMELGNGYQELLSPTTYRDRFNAELQKRSSLAKPCPPLDERLLQAIDGGLPPCSGVAVGFDRLIQLALGVSALSDVLLFPWGDH